MPPLSASCSFPYFNKCIIKCPHGLAKIQGVFSDYSILLFPPFNPSMKKVYKKHRRFCTSIATVIQTSETSHLDYRNFFFTHPLPPFLFFPHYHSPHKNWVSLKKNQLNYLTSLLVMLLYLSMILRGNPNSLSWPITSIIF